MIDTDIDSLDKIRNSTHARIYSPDNFVYTSQPTGNNFATAYHRCASDIIDHFSDVFRKQMEACESLHAIQLFHSLSGGAGSGIMSKLLNHVSDDCPKKIIVTATGFPSGAENSSDNTNLEIYNSILALHNIIEYPTLA